MIITINQKKLKEGVFVVEKIVSKNITLPILQNIVLKTENGRLKLSATNLEIGVSFWLGAKIEEEGEIALPARIFSDFISNVHDEKITISTKGDIAFINSNNYKTKIIGFSTKDFPIIPKSKNTVFTTISSHEILLLLTKVVDATSLSETRPELAGVFLHFSSYGIEGAATDSFRLAEQIIEKEGEPEHSIIIPKVTIQELIRTLADRQEDVSIYLSENQIFFKTSDVEIVSRLIDGHYPDYKRVIPEKYQSRLVVSKEELEKSVRLASIFTSHVADIKVAADKDGLKITAKNVDKGEVERIVPGDLKNDPFQITVNFHYLLDGLKNISTENVVVEFTGEGSPLVLRPENEKGFTYLVMPLRS